MKFIISGLIENLLLNTSVKMESAINFAMKKAGVVELEEKHPLSAS